MKNILLITLILLCAAAYSQSKYKNLFEQNGKIGIGTKKPDALLTVKGNIHTQEVLVDLKGAVAPDYVFQNYFNGESKLNPNYKFQTLKQVEDFVAKNHHLPGIPSAETLDKDGLSLKKMNLVLLEKIEELTLYLIEQQKEIETLKEIVYTLKE
jgi:hypothetical protein